MHIRACIFLFAFLASGITSTEASFTPRGNFTLPFAQTYENLSASDKKQVDCLAKNIYYESVGEPHQGRLAVASVTMNRIRSKDFPSTICEVVYQRVNRVYQFSWVGQKRLYKIEPDVYNEIRDLAVHVFINYDSQMDNTSGSLYFHATYVSPKWHKLKRTKRIGRHIFYKDT